MAFSLTMNCLEFVKRYEPFLPQAEADEEGRIKLGYGHTKGVLLGQLTDLYEAEQWLIDDLGEIIQGLNSLVFPPLQETQWIALVDLTFDIGLKAFSTSSLLKLVNSLMFAKASEQLVKWVKIKKEGVLVPSEVRRRKRIAERKLWDMSLGYSRKD